MKPLPLLLSATLVVNFALASLLARKWSARSAASPAVPSSVTNALPPSAIAKPARIRARTPASAPSSSGETGTNFHWAAVETPDFRAYIQNLRALGIPEDIVRDLVTAEVTHRYRLRQIALWQTTRQSSNYWENGMGAWEMSQPSLPVRRQMAALEREMTAELKSLLGDDTLYHDHDHYQFFANLAPDLRRQVMALGEAREAKQEQFDMSGMFYDEQAHQGRKQADRDYYAELAKLVPADQLEAFKLRYSDTASNLRNELRGFTPTEEEFKALFRLREAAEAGQPSDTPKPVKADEQALKQQAEEKALVEALGPERAKEFAVLKDNHFYQLIESGVPAADLMRMDAMKQSLTAAANQLKANTALTAEQRAAAQLALRTEMETELKKLIGERRANFFLSSNGRGYFGQFNQPMEEKP